MDIPSRLVGWGVVLVTTTACALIFATVPAHAESRLCRPGPMGAGIEHATPPVLTES